MKGSKNINSALSIFGLVLLLLLSPCKVRNFIQAELGIPQTQVLNKSLSTIAQSNCQTFELAETAQATSKLTNQHSIYPVHEAFALDFTTYIFRHAFDFTTSRSQSASTVPFYILYQHLKVYA